MPKPDPQVTKVVERIIESVRPEKIILFGSRAKGGVGPESDIDLLIVYSGSISKRELKVAIHKLFEHPDFSLDVFVLTPEELEFQRQVANTLAREATEQGVVCYG
ncbi:MAG: nucleotidyltransferase domain-containing protein [Gammaproteobacteria bacterium]